MSGKSKTDETVETDEQQAPEPQLTDDPGTTDEEEGGEVVELAPEPEPELTDLQKAERTIAELQARLRSVSKAFNDQKQEMASFRERTEHQIKLRAERTAFETVQTFFDPVQNLKRSLATEASEVPADGIRMVLHQFMASMHRLGLREVPGVGAAFDPNVHEALAVMPVTEPDKDGVVLIVHSDGYAVGGKVLQAAQVVIGKYEEGAEPAEA